MMLITGCMDKPATNTRQTSCDTEGIQQYLQDNNTWELDTPRREGRHSLFDQESFAPFHPTDPYWAEFMSDKDLMESGTPQHKLERAKLDMREWPKIRTERLLMETARDANLPASDDEDDDPFGDEDETPATADQTLAGDFSITTKTATTARISASSRGMTTA